MVVTSVTRPWPGMLQADPGVTRDAHNVFRLFVHETQRVFHDRLVNGDDKAYFNQIMSEMASKHFSEVCLCRPLHVAAVWN